MLSKPCKQIIATVAMYSSFNDTYFRKSENIQCHDKNECYFQTLGL